MKFVETSIEAMQTMVGPKRVVMWEEVGPDKKVLYLSAGAVSILEGLVTTVPNPQQVSPTDLPSTRVMMLGDASDWDK